MSDELSKVRRTLVCRLRLRERQAETRQKALHKKLVWEGVFSAVLCVSLPSLRLMVISTQRRKDTQRAAETTNQNATFLCKATRQLRFFGRSKNRTI